MRGLGIYTLCFLLTLASFGQGYDVETVRSLAYQAKLDKDFATSIEYYQQILDTDSTDYDARLALARLFTLMEDYQDAMSYYNYILENDSTDVEAMNGLGECYGLTGKDKKSIYYYDQALKYLPDNVQQYFYLARAYGNAGMMEQAIEVYLQINRIDDTYAEAWAGIGKMYYWKGKPETAVQYYEKALQLDPGNEETLNEYKSVLRELDFEVSASFGPVNEKEESYEITALITKAGLQKRIDDHFHVQAGFLLDYSNRDYKGNAGDTTRWYTSGWAKGSFISEHHTFSAYGGYSTTDDKFSSYGLNWKLDYSPGAFSVKNSINAGYDYFYYWNKVGGKAVTDEIKLSYRILGFDASYTYGMIDAVSVYNAEGSLESLRNPYQAYSLSLIFKVLKRPEIKIAVNHSYLDYEYKSPLYYSPFGRRLTGASASAYYKVHDLYIYGYFAYNVGSEYNDGKKKETKIDVDNWSSNIELGYNFNPLSVAIGASNFYNPYYQNLSAYIAVKVLF